MSERALNSKSDVKAKEAFRKKLLERGFDSAEVTGSPADITACKGDQTYYFEIKYTAAAAKYFGAATLTEWEAAMKYESRYSFVVAMNRNGEWGFHEYTPAEFMAFSSIPPFKIYFNVPVDAGKSTEASPGKTRVQLTRERIVKMTELFQQFRSKSS